MIGGEQHHAVHTYNHMVRRPQNKVNKSPFYPPVTVSRHTHADLEDVSLRLKAADPVADLLKYVVNKSSPLW